MPSIEIKPAIKVRMEEILDGISHLDTPDLEIFLREVGHLLAKRKATTLSKRETQLLLKINEAVFPDDVQKEYDELYKKLSSEKISPQQHQRLLVLIKQREESGVEKLACLIELAQLKKVSLSTLLDQLGIQSISDA